MKLTLLSRPQCHLCQEAASLLRRLRIGFDTVDVDSDNELRRRFGDAIPVILAGEFEVARAPIDDASLREKLGLKTR